MYNVLCLISIAVVDRSFRTAVVAEVDFVVVSIGLLKAVRTVDGNAVDQKTVIVE